MAGLPLIPPRPYTQAGTPRRIGVEIEFAGPTCAEAANLVRRLFGGKVAEVDPYLFEIHGTRLGDFAVELDMSMAHKPDPDVPDEESLGNALEKYIRSALGTVGNLIMPSEITTPPLQIDALPEIDRLVAALGACGGRGTRSSPLNAFGLHLNPELAAEDADYLVDQLKAFMLTEAWLRDGGIDPSRLLSAVIAHFPADYVRKVVDPGYRPDRDRLIDDYLDATPSRNRALDMLPAFLFLDPQRVRARMPDRRIKARPTFHYRLPDSRVGQAHWGIIADWNRWVMVERLAADRARLDGMGADFLEHERSGGAAEWLHQLWRWMP